MSPYKDSLSYRADGVKSQIGKILMDEGQELQRLAMVAASLARAVSELWETYLDTMDLLDMDNDNVVDKAHDMVAELEHNLVETVGQIHTQLYLMSGVHEPLPAPVDGDMESSVLHGIAGIDDYDIESLRVDPPKVSKEAQDKADHRAAEEYARREHRDDDLLDLTDGELRGMISEFRDVVDDFGDWDE